MYVIRSLLPVVAVAVIATGCRADTPLTNEVPGQRAAAAVSADTGEVVRDAVTVDGVGQASGRPDVVRATLGVEVSADSVQEALDTSNERATEVIDALQDAGVAAEDIQTQELSVRDRRPPPRPEPREGEAPEASEIVATNVVEARIRDVDRVGEVLQQASDAGGDATRIRGVQFEVEADDEILETARERAFEDARQKAEQFAELSGRELGDLVILREQGPSRGPAPPRALEAEDAAVPVEPGTEQLQVRITAVWALE